MNNPELEAPVPAILNRPKTSDKRKTSIYFPKDMLAEIQAEAERQERPVSQVLQMAWNHARATVKKFPDVPGREG